MGLEYTAISRFDLSCCTGLEVRFTESNNFGEPFVTNILATVDPNTGELLLSSPAGSELPLAATQIGNPYTVTHTVTSIINPNNCPLPAELTLPDPTPIVYTYDVTQQQVDDCTECIVNVGSLTQTMDCTGSTGPVANLFQATFGRNYLVPPCCTDLEVTYTVASFNFQTFTATPDASGNLFIGATNDIITGPTANPVITITDIQGEGNCTLPFSVTNTFNFPFDVAALCPCTYSLNTTCSGLGNLGISVNSPSMGYCTGGTLSRDIPPLSTNVPTGNGVNVDMPVGASFPVTFTFTPNNGSAPITSTLDIPDLDACQNQTTFYSCCDGTPPCSQATASPCANGNNTQFVGTISTAFNLCSANCASTYYACDGTDCNQLTDPCTGNNCFVDDNTCGGGCDDPCDGLTMPITAEYDCDAENLTVTATGGTAPYMFTLNGGSIPPNPFPLPDANHTIVVTDANGCMDDIMFNPECTDPCAISVFDNINLNSTPCTTSGNGLISGNTSLSFTCSPNNCCTGATYDYRVTATDGDGQVRFFFGSGNGEFTSTLICEEGGFAGGSFGTILDVDPDTCTGGTWTLTLEIIGINNPNNCDLPISVGDIFEDTYTAPADCCSSPISSQLCSDISGTESGVGIEDLDISYTIDGFGTIGYSFFPLNAADEFIIYVNNVQVFTTGCNVVDVFGQVDVVENDVLRLVVNHACFGDPISSWTLNLTCS